MAVKVSGTTIVATRGDTIKLHVELYDSEEHEYIPQEGDRIRFAMKVDYNDAVPVLEKEIPIDTQILKIEPEDTKHLPQPSQYVYDIQITYANGDVDTFIDRAKFKLTEEVE